MRGDGAKKPFRHAKSGSFSPVSFLPSTRKILGPAQRPHPLGKKEIQRKGHVFSFSHSFFFLQKKEWEKKEKRHPRPLRFVSQRRLRRNPRRLASQRRLPSRDPAAGGACPTHTNIIHRWNMNVGEQLAAPALPDSPGEEKCAAAHLQPNGIVFISAMVAAPANKTGCRTLTVRERFFPVARG